MIFKYLLYPVGLYCGLFLFFNLIKLIIYLPVVVGEKASLNPLKNEYVRWGILLGCFIMGILKFSKTIWGIHWIGFLLFIGFQIFVHVYNEKTEEV